MDSQVTVHSPRTKAKHISQCASAQTRHDPLKCTRQLHGRKPRSRRGRLRRVRQCFRSSEGEATVTFLLVGIRYKCGLISLLQLRSSLSRRHSFQQRTRHDTIYAHASIASMIPIIRVSLYSLGRSAASVTHGAKLQIPKNDFGQDRLHKFVKICPLRLSVDRLVSNTEIVCFENELLSQQAGARLPHSHTQKLVCMHRLSRIYLLCLSLLNLVRHKQMSS